MRDHGLVWFILLTGCMHRVKTLWPSLNIGAYMVAPDIATMVLQPGPLDWLIVTWKNWIQAPGTHTEPQASQQEF